MKNKIIKCILLSLILITGILTACTSAKQNNKKESLAGYIISSGSTSIQPLIEKLAEDFKIKHPKLNIIIQGGDTETGLIQVIKETIDIGSSDISAERKLNKEQALQLIDNKIAVESFAIITSKDVNIKSLTKKQLAQIFSGEKTNWKDFGGEDKKIIVVHRPTSSGARSIFVDKILDGKEEFENDKMGIIQDSSENVKTTLETTNGTISYIGLSYINDKESKELINVLNIDDIEPESKNIINGSYPFWSWAHMYTKGEANEIEKGFINYIKSEENKEVVKNLGFIPINEMKVE